MKGLIRSALKTHWIFILVITGLGIMMITSNGFAYFQDPKTVLFQEANDAKIQADKNEAKFYSPERYASALKHYEQAEVDYDKGKNLEDVRNRIKMAAVYFLQSVESAKMFKNNISECVAAREDALAAEAPAFQKEKWQDAENALADAATILEKGNLEGARKKAGDAERLYRNVELESIKANYLNETRELLKKAEDMDVDKRAPVTLANAQKLADRAELMLTQNRYDTDEARQIAVEAKYEAQHAIYLSELITIMTKEKTSIETLLLNSEIPLQKIANEFDLKARFDNGYDAPTQILTENIQQLQKENASLNQDLADHKEQISALTSQVTEMQSQLGDLRTKEASLKQVMEQQRVARERFKRVEELFLPEEAQIIRVGDQVVTRLYGLSFPSGKSNIETQYFGILSKVLKSIDVYPGCGITVEGHTDSWGGDELNQKLSTQRAEAVREYLLANANLESSRVIAVGYGETKPVASNETQEGRRKNRRIDIVIHPEK